MRSLFNRSTLMTWEVLITLLLSSPGTTLSQTISGIISYSGTSVAPIHVIASKDSSFRNNNMIKAHVKLDSPGSYTLTGLPDGKYFIVSTMMSDSDYGIMLTDAWGIYGTMGNHIPIIITGGSSVSGINITLADATEQNPNPFYSKYSIQLWSSNWHYGEGYLVDFKVLDTDSEATSVVVTGPGITETFYLEFDQNDKQWKRPTDRIVNFYNSPPNPPITYTFTIVDSKITTVLHDTVESFIHVYATNLSPSGGEAITGSLVFSWTWDEPNYTHWIQLYDADGNEVWNIFGLTEKSFIYDGPALTYGAIYNYNVAAEDMYGNQSFAEESFTYMVDVGVTEERVPYAFKLSQNTPNPFNPTTTISFTIPEASYVTTDIFNVAGQRVATLVNGRMSAGSHSVVWDAANFSAGIYFYTVKSGQYSKTMKMTLLK